jgi:membrane protease YdiL (CAAX protease family)
MRAWLSKRGGRSSFRYPRRRVLAEPPRHAHYLIATRHAWPCLLFLLPLLIAYEAGVLWVGGTQPEALRNGADTWLRWGLDAFGLHQLYWAPVLVVAILVATTCLTWRDRPADVAGVCLGMAVESVLFALLLWGLSCGLQPLLEALREPLNMAASDDGGAQVVTFVGAGIYEEVLFRLLLYTGLAGMLRLLGAPGLPAMIVAALLSATLFAAAHHIGPYGEPFEDGVFLFRALAGLYFASLYQLRGFGIAVGAHACYDVLVGVALS